MQINKMLKTFLAAFFLLLLLAACGEDQTPLDDSPRSTLNIITATPRNTATPTVTPTPEVPVMDVTGLSGITLDFWYAWNPAYPDTVAELVDRFNRENEYGVQVSARRFVQNPEFEDVVQSAIHSGSIPQLALALPYQYMAWQVQDALVNQTPYLESAEYGLTASQVEDFYPAFLARDLVDGERWGMPGLISAEVLLYNQGWAQSLGFSSIPTRASAFNQQACAAQEENGDGTGGWMVDTSPGVASAWLLAFAGTLESDGGYDFEVDGVRVSYTFLADLWTQDCAWYPAASYPDQAFVNRDGLFYSVNTRDISYVAQAFEEANSPDEWIPIGYPNDLGDSAVSIFGPSYVMLQATIEEQIASWMFIRYMLEEDAQITLAENDLYLPLTRSVAASLQADSDLPAQWLDALDLLDTAVFEPRLASWRVVRAMPQDALAEVMNDRFSANTISLLVRQLNETAQEFNQ